MMKRGWRVWAVVFLAPVCAVAATGAWKNFSSMKEVRGVVHDGSSFWAATSGGLFRWNSQTNDFLLLTNAEGLRNIDLTAVNIDHAGDVWSGSTNGVLHVYTPSTGTIRPILDIATANQTNKKINAIVVQGDTALICTDFGLSVFRIGRFEFGDTYSRFGSVPAATRTTVLSAAIHNARLYACISDGQTVNRVAVASLGNPNLLPPESWTLHTVGEPGFIPRTLTVFNGKLYSGTTGGLFYEDSGGWVPVGALSGTSIVAATAGATALYVTTAAREVYAVSAQNTATPFGTTLPYSSSSVTTDAQGIPVVGSTDGGLLTGGTQWTSHIPNGPGANQFLSLVVDPGGVLWCGSGDVSGRGLYRYDGTTWTTFTMANSALPSNDVHRLSVACNGTVWASTYGRGAVELLPGSTRIDSSRIFGRNVGMVGISGDTNYVVVSNVVCDSRGNVWMSVVLAADKNLLVTRRADGTWKTIPVSINGNKLTSLMDRPVDRCLAVDAFDNLWAIVRDGAFRGIISLGNAGTLDSTAAFHITSANGLPSNEVKTIVVDGDNDIWVGTDRGITIILDPSNPTRKDAIAAYKPLNGLVINTIAVDPLNQKWVGTTEGVFLLSPDGTQTLASYTVENTQGRVIDNDVKTIGIDQKTGTVYFGTLYGMASLTTAAAAPKASFDVLTIYPNPFFIPAATQLTVSGLVKNASMKIVAIDGRVVRDIKSPGGLVGFWDGKDGEGEFVSSGVYIVIASAEDGSAVATGKIAVIKQ
jgi:hypothetical protein